jgi:hypothetical protein
MEDAMKRVLIVAVVAAALSSMGHGQDVSPANSIERLFADGGLVQLRLSSGNYTVRAGSNDHLVVRWQTENPEHLRDLARIKVHADVSGMVATIRTEGPTKNARILIEIPAHSDLFLRLRAGDVQLSGIEGNKDIGMTAGDLKIDVLPASYAHVHASVTLGDVRAQPLGISRDGIRNSFEWNGTGKYTLRASLFAGDLTLSDVRARR